MTALLPTGNQPNNDTARSLGKGKAGRVWSTKMKKEYPKHPKSATVALLEVRLIRSRRALLAAAELLRRFEERDRVAHELSLAQSERLRLRHLENLALREQIAVAGVSS